MVLQAEAKKLTNHIKSLGLNIPPRKPSHKHVGAIIADAILQGGGHRYETQVKPCAERIQDKYPSAATISGLSYLLKTQGAQELLNWSGKDEQGRFCQTVSFFENEGINTSDDLRKWLESEDNRDRLVTKNNRHDKAGIPEISDATADYYRVLVRLPNAVKIDRRVKNFLKDAGIRIGMYEYKDLRSIVQLAAKQLNAIPLDLDAAIWSYSGKTRRDAEKEEFMNNEEKKEGETGKDTDRLPVTKASEFAHRKGYNQEAGYIDSLKDILGPRPSFQLREALYMRLFQKKGSWDCFKKMHWSKGNSPQGQKRAIELNRTAEGFLSYLQDIADGRRPPNEAGV